MRLHRYMAIIMAILMCQSVVANAASAEAPGKSAKKATKAEQAKRDGVFVNNHYVLGPIMKMNGYKSDKPTVVIVDKGSHNTYALQLQERGVVRVLTISNAIGSQDKPTPSGRYTVTGKKQYPEWIVPKTIKNKKRRYKPYNQDRNNPLGVAAIYLNKYELLLHGTNQPNLIRKSVSHGCIRHSNSDISQLYGMVRAGTPVYVVRRFRGTVLNKSDFGSRKAA
ncbi:MAG TPA: L,D-transpeptidase [Candidatus Melainabacteria bacterium]|jgi:lipoprotein-anchoring transpeptidase ErfK/SrfK|nr:L,D-transpeptidase [Candidatus Melainabacteria bacterium]HIN65637.1 L,D-transpeptidase [Candidatus Obscuribacterales bacterium]